MTRPAGRGIFVLGRQHSGNTLLAALLGRARGAVAMTWEGTFFEHRAAIDRAPAALRAGLVAERSGFRGPLVQEVEAVLSNAVADGVVDTDAASLYDYAMSHLATQADASVWVQKATSYIFYARSILRALPSSRMVYVLRDPRDVAASTKARDRHSDHLCAVGIAWRKGLHAAEELVRSEPCRFTIVRYEDLLWKPERTLRDLFSFAGLRYDRDIHEQAVVVNPAEAQYQKTLQMGFDKGKIGRHEAMLTRSERLAITLVSGRHLLARNGYRQSADGTHASTADQMRVVPLLVRGVFRYGASYLQRFRDQPRHVLQRSAVRARATLGMSHD